MGSLPSVAGVLGTPWVCLERGGCVAHEGAATRPGKTGEGRGTVQAFGVGVHFFVLLWDRHCRALRRGQTAHS